MSDTITTIKDQPVPTRPEKPEPSKKERLRALIARRHGASLEKLVAELGWQPHTVRAAISGLRKSGVGIELDRSKKTPVYRISAAGAE